MLYSTLLIAASAIAGASAQLISNGTSYNTPIPCCSLPANQLSSDRRSEICEAQFNTCNELCGGVGRVASNGNICDKVSSQHPHARRARSCICSKPSSTPATAPTEPRSPPRNWAVTSRQSPVSYAVTGTTRASTALATPSTSSSSAGWPSSSSVATTHPAQTRPRALPCLPAPVVPLAALAAAPPPERRLLTLVKPLVPLPPSPHTVLPSSLVVSWPPLASPCKESKIRRGGWMTLADLVRHHVSALLRDLSVSSMVWHRRHMRLSQFCVLSSGWIVCPRRTVMR